MYIIVQSKYGHFEAKFLNTVEKPNEVCHVFGN